MPFGFALVAAALTGFIALSYEILWYRVFGFVAAGVAATFPLLLGAYLTGLALGASNARAICERFDRSEAPARALAAFAVFVNVVGFFVIPALSWIVRFTVWGWALPVVAVAAAMLGAVFPLLCHIAIAADDRVGARLSYIYAANILGSTLGSLLTGYVLMQFWDTLTIARILVVSGLGLSALLCLATLRGRQAIGAVAGIAAVAIAVYAGAPALHDGLYERLLYKQRYTGQRFDRVVENRHGVIAVTKDHDVFGGGIYDGMARVDLEHDPNHLIRALTVAAVRPVPRRVLVIGLGTGSWAQVLEGLPGVEQVVAIDINPGYLELIQRYPDVASLLTNSRVRIEIDDARRWLHRHPEEKFDAIVSNTTFNWHAFTSALLSKEFMQLARAHLNQNGVFLFNTTDSPNAFRTAFEAFPYGLRVMNFAVVSDAPLEMNLAQWRGAMTNLRIDGAAPLDTTTADGRARLDGMTRLLESRDGWYGTPIVELASSMRPRLRQVAEITDDNMGTEWRTLYPPLYMP
jgi:spermidine synthase